jgi:hypothetical protein
MFEALLEIDTEAWIRGAKNNRMLHLARQASEVLLYAIANSIELKSDFYLKGGVLMGLGYNSPRQTNDLDFTSILVPSQDVLVKLKVDLEKNLKRSAEKLGYDQLVFRIHSLKPSEMPIHLDETTWPTIEIKVGFALRNGRQHQKLDSGVSNSVIKMDVTFSEPAGKIQILELKNGSRLLAYSLSWLVAEKYRAILQQPIRKRNRRQDVYDINLLLQHPGINESQKPELLQALFDSCKARNILPHRNSLDDEEVKSMAGADWNSLKLEVNEIPDFDECYHNVASFYRDLPWASGV